MALSFRFLGLAALAALHGSDWVSRETRKKVDPGLSLPSPVDATCWIGLRPRSKQEKTS